MSALPIRKGFPAANQDLRWENAEQTSSRLKSGQLGRQVLPESALPRDIRLRINLKLLSWYLKDNLPELMPEHFPLTPAVSPLNEQGWSNHTFIVKSGSGNAYVVRMKRIDLLQAGEKQTQWSDYHKEEWIMKHIHSEVPVAEVLKKGIGYVPAADGQHEYAYMVQSFIPYYARKQTLKPKARKEFLAAVGRVARLINQTAVPGFGRSFDVAGNRFACPTWHHYLQQELETCGLEQLTAKGIVSEDLSGRIRRRILSLTDLQFEPALFHSDFIFNWDNILCSADGAIKGIIDWELAGAGPAVHYELATALYVLHRDNLTKRQINQDFGAVLAGYGITKDQFEKNYAYDVETIMLLNAVAKTHRYLRLAESGELQQHPWRMKFAQRAAEIVARLAA